MMRQVLRSLVPLAVVLASADAARAQESAILEEGIRLYTEQGNAREAIRRLGDGLDAGVISGLSGVRAHVYMANSFLALGDTLSALTHIQAALAAEPCLVPPPDLTPPPWQALYDRNRPDGASCGRTLPFAALQSILVPGWSQYAAGRSGPARYFFVATVATAGGAWLLHRRAEAAYAEYQSSTVFEDVTGHYDEAEGSRRLALTIGGAAAAIYAWNVFDAVVSAAGHDRAISRVRPLSFRPTVAPGADGVRLGFSVVMDHNR